MLKLRKAAATEPLVVSMTGLRMADRVLILGCGTPNVIGVLAPRPGLTGRVCVIDEDPSRTARGAQAAEREGALVEADTAPFTMLPFEADAFDVVIANHLLPLLPEDKRVRALGEALRVLRPAGRCVAIERGRRSGIAALLGGSGQVAAQTVQTAMEQGGFSGVRVLADREGLVFVEGAKKKG